VTNVDFTAIPGAFPDSFEPNNSFATAASLGPLPYPGSDPLSVTPADGLDFYSFHPAPGKSLRVRVVYDKVRVGDDALSLSLLNSGGFVVKTGSIAGAGIELRYSGTDGDPYVIRVLAINTFSNYRVFVQQYDAVDVTFGATLGGQPVMDASIMIYNSEFDLVQAALTDDLGLTFSYPALPGESLYAECLAYQLDIDRNTRLVTAVAAMPPVIFEASGQGLDAHEPNSAFFSIGPALDLPAQFSASIGSAALGDFTDYYEITTFSTQPLRIATSMPPGCSIYLDFFDSLYGYIGGSEMYDGSVVYFPSDGLNGQRIAIYSAGNATEYSLDLSHSTAYQLSGQVLDGAVNPVDFSYLYNATLNQYYPHLGGGSYAATSLLPPGNYQLYVMAPNYGPNGPYTAQIIGSDLIFDITGLTYSNTEPNEPDDTPATATVIALDDLQTGRVLGDQTTNDYYDYFRFSATAGQKLRVQLTAAAAWQYFFFSLLNATATTSLGFSADEPPDIFALDFIAPYTGDYYVECSGEGEYELIVKVYP
jgi:hypothetical protein